MNIVETAVGNADFSTLVAAVTAAGLVEALSAEGPFTVFAPTNAAFAKLPAGTVESLVLPENKDKLTAILLLHVVEGKMMSGDLAGKEMDVATLGGEIIEVEADEDGVEVNDARVVLADVVASNGVIHAIDTVLMPGTDD